MSASNKFDGLLEDAKAQDADILSLKQQLSDAQRNSASLRGKIESLKLEISALNNQAGELKEKATELKNTNSELESQVDRLNGSLTQLTISHNHLTLQAETHSAELGALREEYRQDLQKLVEEQRSISKARDDKYDQVHTAELNVGQDALQQARSELRELRIQRVDQDDTISHLEGKTKRLQSEKDAADNVALDKDVQTGRLKLQLNEQSSRITELNGELSAHVTKQEADALVRADRSGRIQSLETTASSSRGEIDRLKLQIQRQTQREADNQSVITNLRESLCQRQDDANWLQSLEEELRQLRAKNVSLEEKLAARPSALMIPSGRALPGTASPNTSPAEPLSASNEGIGRGSSKRLSQAAFSPEKESRKKAASPIEPRGTIVRARGQSQGPSRRTSGDSRHSRSRSGTPSNILGNMRSLSGLRSGPTTPVEAGSPSGFGTSPNVGPAGDSSLPGRQVLPPVPAFGDSPTPVGPIYPARVSDFGCLRFRVSETKVVERSGEMSDSVQQILSEYFAWVETRTKNWHKVKVPLTSHVICHWHQHARDPRRKDCEWEATVEGNPTIFMRV